VALRALIYIRELTPYRGPLRVMIQVKTILIPMLNSTRRTSVARLPLWPTVIIGRRLLDKVVYRIKIRIKAGKAVLAIIEAVKVGKKTIYKIRLNLNI
jgi:hypothetical protein